MFKILHMPTLKYLKDAYTRTEFMLPDKEKLEKFFHNDNVLTFLDSKSGAPLYTDWCAPSYPKIDKSQFTIVEVPDEDAYSPDDPFAIL